MARREKAIDQREPARQRVALQAAEALRRRWRHRCRTRGALRRPAQPARRGRRGAVGPDPDHEGSGAPSAAQQQRGGQAARPPVQEAASAAQEARRGLGLPHRARRGLPGRCASD